MHLVAPDSDNLEPSIRKSVQKMLYQVNIWFYHTKEPDLLIYFELTN